MRDYSIFGSSMIENLHDIEWEPRWFKLGKDCFVEAVMALEARISEEYPSDLVWGH